MALHRRTLLRAAGVSLALPWLEAFAAAPPEHQTPNTKHQTPRRLVCVCAPLGLHPEAFFPKKAGKDYEATPHLEVLKEHRADFTVMSGLQHPDVGHSHDSIFSFLTTAPHPERRAGFKNSISVDQLAAEHIGGETRFPSLALSCEGFSLSWTRTGALVPSDCWPTSVFSRLFLPGRPEDVKEQARRLRDGQSILDAVRGEARKLHPKIASSDREKLDEYFTSVRELEGRMARAGEWGKKPKPKVDVKPPVNANNPADVVGKARLMFDLMHLALQTDSTRLMTLLLLGTSSVPPIAGVSQGHHDLSHHGKDPTKIDQLKKVEVEKLKTLSEFLGKLKATKEGGGTLLDTTSVFFSSNLGNASTHSVKNLPVILAGGGFKHGQHLAFPEKGAPPLGDLFVSLLQRLGVKADRFGSGSRPLAGLS